MEAVSTYGVTLSSFNVGLSKLAARFQTGLELSSLLSVIWKCLPD